MNISKPYMKVRPNKLQHLFFFIAVALLAKWLPHPANVSPLLALSVLLPSWVVLPGLLLSDCLIAPFSGIPVWGSWTLFTYSGYLLLSMLWQGICPSQRSSRLALILASSFGWWLWTNLGVFLCSGLYTASLEGFIQCYLAAIPFLKNALLGDILWLESVYILMHRVKQLPQTKPF